MSAQSEELKTFRNILSESMEYNAFLYGVKDRKQLYGRAASLLCRMASNYKAMADDPDSEESQQLVIDFDDAYNQMLNRRNK